MCYIRHYNTSSKWYFLHVLIACSTGPSKFLHSSVTLSTIIYCMLRTTLADLHCLSASYEYAAIRSPKCYMFEVYAFHLSGWERGWLHQQYLFGCCVNCFRLFSTVLLSCRYSLYSDVIHSFASSSFISFLAPWKTFKFLIILKIHLYFLN